MTGDDSDQNTLRVRRFGDTTFLLVFAVATTTAMMGPAVALMQHVSDIAAAVWILMFNVAFWVIAYG